MSKKGMKNEQRFKVSKCCDMVRYTCGGFEWVMLTGLISP
jgi:hypothetical protein